MTHTTSSHLSDAALLAWLDGDATAAEHMARCQHCQARARDLRQQETALRKIAHRMTCPPAHTLAEYALGLLPNAQHNELSQHLAHCPHCRQELALQQQFMAATAPATAPAPTPAPASAPTLGQQVKIIVAQLLQDARDAWQNTGTGSLQPALAAMRGQVDGPQIYTAGDYQLSLELIPDPENQGRRALIGLLLGDNAPETFEIQLWQQDALITHTRIDPHGNFSINKLPPGNYELKLIRPQLIIHLNNVTL